MSIEDNTTVSGEKFRETLESQVEAGEGAFSQPHPFLRTACKGLAGRLNGNVNPMGFVMATELYIYDIETGVDGFTGDPMPSETQGFPQPAAGAIIRLTAVDLARDAFGQEFGDAVKEQYDAVFTPTPGE